MSSHQEPADRRSEHARDGGSELVHYEVDGALARITLDSPHNRNALSRQLVTELLERLARAAHDDDVRVVVVGATGTVFCSGADLSEASADGMEEGARAMVDMQRAIVALPKPVVVRVQGPVRAGGIGIVAACDVALCTRDATFALTEVKLGLAPAVISLTVLPRLTSRAASLTFLGGEVFDGEAAAQMGLVTRAVDGERLDEEIEALGTSLASGAPQGLRETKALLAGPLLERIDTHRGEVAAQSARLFGSEAAKQAMAAFLNRGR